MATLFRAMVMLSVLVGLPAAWVYYGPLPPQAQRKVDELIERGKLAVGWPSSEPHEDPAAFDPAGGSFLSGDSLDEAPAFQAKSAAGMVAPEAVVSAAAVSPAIGPAATGPVTPENPNPTLETNIDAQAEALLAELRELGAEEYALESWGSAGELYRFRCEMPLAATASLTRQFEAVASAPQESIAQVVAEVASWRSER